MRSAGTAPWIWASSATSKSLPGGAERHPGRDGRRRRPAEAVQRLGGDGPRRPKGRKGAGKADVGSETLPIHPMRLAKEVNDFMNREDDIVVADGGDTSTWMGMTRTVAKGGTYLDYGLYGCLAVGIPYANAAKLRNPENGFSSSWATDRRASISWSSTRPSARSSRSSWSSATTRAGA